MLVNKLKNSQKMQIMAQTTRATGEFGIQLTGRFDMKKKEYFAPVKEINLY